MYVKGKVFLQGLFKSKKKDLKNIDNIFDEVNSKIKNTKIANQFILEELEAASQGNQFAQSFVKESGIDSSIYIGAMKNSFEEVDGPNGPQQTLLKLVMLFNNIDTIVEVRLKIVDRIMKQYSLGKYRKSMYSTTKIAKLFNIKARPYLFDFLVEKDFIEKITDKYEIKSKGFNVGAEYHQNNNERWIVWDEKNFIDVINDFKLYILKQCNIGTIDHMTHISNLESILKNGLLSHDNPYKKVDISNFEVNDRRNKNEPIYDRSIHKYVPFYFNPRNAMLYRNQNTFGNDIIILGFDNSIILNNNFVVSDSNAASDNASYTNDLTDILNIEFINWKKVFSDSWNNYGNPDYALKQMMMAEILIYKKVKSEYIKIIFCQNNNTQQYIMNNFQVSNIEVVVDPRLFF